jgi:hypothetical protein
MSAAKPTRGRAQSSGDREKIAADFERDQQGNQDNRYAGCGQRLPSRENFLPSQSRPA